MLENQFIQFSIGILSQDNVIAVPTGSGINTTFFIENDDRSVQGIDIVTPDGTIVIVQDAVQTSDGKFCTLFNLNALAPGDFYRIRLNRNGTYEYSNILRREPEDTQHARVKYHCKEDAFGFPFTGARNAIQQLIPINLYSPQYKQEDKIYTKRNGEQVVLFANITKEYEGETDYIPMDWHEKILIALSCDVVYINGERVTKSGNYEIDHDNCTYTDCGIKLMRATFKMTTNVTQRNSNY